MPNSRSKEVPRKASTSSMRQLVSKQRSPQPKDTLIMQKLQRRPKTRIGGSSNVKATTK